MGSTLAIERNIALPNALPHSPERSPHRHRVGVLAERIAMHVQTLVPRGRSRCLDIGCGDMTIAEAVQAHATRSDWSCTDVYPVPSGRENEPRWGKYVQFDGERVPYRDDEFDIALLCDVLRDTPENAGCLLAEARRVARSVIVKDQFEYGGYSRSMLRLMDFVGHRGERAAVRGSFLTRDGFVRLATGQGLVISSIDVGIELGPPPGPRSPRRDCHFIAVLHRDRA
jgi:hypothetical protein